MPDACIAMGGFVLLLTYNGLGTKDEEGLGLDEVPSEGAIGVLEHYNEGQLLSRGQVGVGCPYPGWHLGDL